LLQFPEYWIIGEISSMVKLYATIVVFKRKQVDTLESAGAYKTKDRQEEAQMESVLMDGRSLGTV
jgi:hypothetical protein